MNKDQKLPGAYGRNFGSKGKVQDLNGVCATMQAAMGNGGGNIPIIREAPLERDGWHRNAKEVLSVDGICRTISTQSNNLATKIKEKQSMRIRKLTPKECWSLMGFDHEDFEKAEKVCSNTQLYKQAGNSIVVSVIEHIYRKLMECGVLMPLEKTNVEQMCLFEDSIHFAMPEEFTVSRKYLRRIDEVISLLNPSSATDDEIKKLKDIVSQIIDEGIQDERCG